MPSSNKRITPQLIERWIKEGRGKGLLSSYKPWLTVFDVSSRGLRSRVKGTKTKRIHHLLSKLELVFFHLCELREPVVDIREQFPLLPQVGTLRIAADLGIRHPADPKTCHPIVLTTDFLLTIRDGATLRYEAWSVKYKKHLDRLRTLDKEEIQRRYWKALGIPWRIFTDAHVTSTLVKNIRYLHAYLDPAALEDLSPECLRFLKTFLLNAVNEGTVLAPLSQMCDQRERLLPGTTLQVARHMLATRCWPVDLSKPLSPRHPLIFSHPQRVLGEMRLNAVTH